MNLPVHLLAVESSTLELVQEFTSTNPVAR